jgi:hypothetical protein
MELLTTEEREHIALIPKLSRQIALLQESLHILFRKELKMADTLDQTLDKLNTTADQVVSLLSTDSAIIAALQASIDALKTANGGDSAEAAKAQIVLDKLVAAVTPVPIPAPAPTDPAPALTDPAGTPTP